MIEAELGPLETGVLILSLLCRKPWKSGDSKETHSLDKVHYPHDLGHSANAFFSDVYLKVFAHIAVPQPIKGLNVDKLLKFILSAYCTSWLMHSTLDHLGGCLRDNAVGWKM